MASRLLLLPRELRDQIYLEYLSTTPDDVYVFDFPSGKLRTSDDHPIDLALMYTCRAVAREMRGMALRTRTITFRTVYSDDLRATAGCFDDLVRHHTGDLLSAAFNLEYYKDEAKMRELGGSYPELHRILRRGFDYNPPRSIWTGESLVEVRTRLLWQHS